MARTHGSSSPPSCSPWAPPARDRRALLGPPALRPTASGARAPPRGCPWQPSHPRARRLPVSAHPTPPHPPPLPGRARRPRPQDDRRGRRRLQRRPRGHPDAQPPLLPHRLPPGGARLPLQEPRVPLRRPRRPGRGHGARPPRAPTRRPARNWQWHPHARGTAPPLRLRGNAGSPLLAVPNPASAAPAGPGRVRPLRGHHRRPPGLRRVHGVGPALRRRSVRARPSSAPSSLPPSSSVRPGRPLALQATAPPALTPAL